MDILNLDEYKLLRVEESEHDYALQVQKKNFYSSCPDCIDAKNIRKFGTLSVIYMDLPVHGKRVGIHIERQRYHCKACGKTFFEALPQMDERRQCTKRLIKYISNKALTHTFTSIASEVGLNETTVRYIFNDYIAVLDKQFKVETPRWLGIDEIHLIRPRCVLTNVEKNTIVDLLDNRDKKKVVSYLTRLPDRQRVELVAIDMWRPYKDAVEFCLPQAQVVIDKYHVVRMANESLDKVRKALRDELTPKERRGLKKDRYVLLKRKRDLDVKEQIYLQAWCEQFPVLKIAYELKEGFYAIWEQPTKTTSAEAKALYDEWVKQVQPEVAEHFLPLITAFDNWHPEIFAYFDSPVTNAYTESLNSLIRVADRVGRGYTFEVLRAKMLYTYGIQKVEKPAYNRNAFKASERVAEAPSLPFTTDMMTSNKRTPLFKAKRYGSNPEKLLLALENLDSLKLTDESDQQGEE